MLIYINLKQKAKIDLFSHWIVINSLNIKLFSMITKQEKNEKIYFIRQMRHKSDFTKGNLKNELNFHWSFNTLNKNIYIYDKKLGAITKANV